MHPHSYASAGQPLGGERVVEVLGARRIDRERGQGAQVPPASLGHLARRALAALLAGALRLALDLLGEGARQAAVEHQRLDRVARDLWAADHAHDPRPVIAPAAGRLHQHEVADARARAARAGDPVRSEDDPPPAPARAAPAPDPTRSAPGAARAACVLSMLERRGGKCGSAAQNRPRFCTVATSVALT